MDQGAHFHRCEFQLHTPRDGNWSGPRPGSAAERMGFARSLVAACRDKGVQAIAVTDHHDFAYYPLIREAAATEVDGDGNPLEPDQRLVVFPGLELTLGVPCQALLILDADFPVDRLSVVLEALAIPAVDHGASWLPPVQRVDHIQSLEQLHEELDRRDWLRGTYIVLPNVTDGGHGTLMRAAMQAKYKDMPCVGGYLDGRIEDKVGEGNRRIFNGTDAAWGNKRIALFQTSDARSSTFEDVGRHSTWVKWAVPTAEALRQACLAHESRIAHEAPPLPSVHVTRMSVSNSRFMGPIELELNAQYNAFIGGRGTGKSTCLEYLRWALCDQPTAGLADDELADHAARRQRLISTTLQPFGAHVEVHFLLNGIPHVVRRHAGPEGLLLKVGQGEFAPASEEDLRSLLPVHAYSQKQLSSVSVRLDEITRFVTAPIQTELADIRGDAVTLAGRIRENYAVLQRHRDLVAASSRDELAVESLLQQAANVRSGLGAVSAEDRACMEEKPRHDSEDAFVQAMTRKVEQAAADAALFREVILQRTSELPSIPADTSDQSPLRAIETEARVALQRLAALGEQAVSVTGSSRQPGSALQNALEAWEGERKHFEEEYAAARARSAAHQTKLDELDELEQRARRLRESVTQQRDELGRLGDPAATHAELRSSWLELNERRAARVERQCEVLNELSGGLIRASLKRAAGLADIGERFRAAISGSGVRGAKVDTFVEALAAKPDPLATWESILVELEPGSENGAAQLSSLGFAANDIERIRQRLTPESWLGLALAIIDDQPSFEYRTKDGEYIEFADASAGQQATALLRVLLNQSGPPLIIDQPEDDLDSQVVLEIVEQIWAAKSRRQLIFSSHNPNLVVNGDAELVVCCDYRAAGDHSGGRIKLQGAIDVKDVRAEITSVMEGGERAFRLRKEKYGF